MQSPDLGAGIKHQSYPRLQRGPRPRHRGRGPGADHAGRPASLQLPHRGGELQHHDAALLDQPEILLGHLLAPGKTGYKMMRIASIISRLTCDP